MAKFSLTFLHKKCIAPQTFIVLFKSDSSDTAAEFAPGQFATLEVEPGQRRSYSFVGITTTTPSYFSETFDDLTGTNQRYFIFLISTKSGGVASKLIDAIEPGVILPAMSPFGKFKLSDNTSSTKNFICTGTGLAPFIPMIQKARADDATVQINLFFGTSADVGDFSHDFFADMATDKHFAIYTGMFPVQVETETEFVKNATVTQIFPTVANKYGEMSSQEFYLCGNPFMIADVKKLLEENNVTSIFSENYGPAVKK